MSSSSTLVRCGCGCRIARWSRFRSTPVPSTGAEADAVPFGGHVNTDFNEVVTEVETAEQILAGVSGVEFVFDFRRGVAGHKGGGSGQGANGFAVVLHRVSVGFRLLLASLAAPVRNRQERVGISIPHAKWQLEALRWAKYFTFPKDLSSINLTRGAFRLEAAYARTDPMASQNLIICWFFFDVVGLAMRRILRKFDLARRLLSAIATLGDSESSGRSTQPSDQP